MDKQRARKSPASRRPRTARHALLLVDLINTWRMADGRSLLRRTVAKLPALQRLRDSAARAGVPVVYVNDNFGQWRSDFHQVIAAAHAAAPASARIVDALHPGDDDFFVLKPRHSAFYATPLDLLLRELRVDTVVLGGVAGDQCVLSTAGAALLRGFRVIVPRDAIPCATVQRERAVVAHFHAAMDIATPYAARLRWR
jgi:nicotinamidase-related amidase